MKVPYAWQVEGRTLASSRINPSLETLASPLFRGKQAHENDGGYYYWQHFKYQGLFSDMAAGLAHLEVSLPSTDRFTQTMGLLSIMTRKV